MTGGTIRGTFLALGVLALGAAPANAQGAGRFAVLPFENSGSYGQDKEVFEGLELGLGVMLSRALARQEGAGTVPPARVREAMQGRQLGRRIDAATAAGVGKDLGARWVVTGTFADFYGKFRLNARLVDARTGQIVQVVSNDDPKRQDRAALGAIVDHVADRLASAAGLPAGPPGTAPPIPAAAITSYSRGLLHESRGDPAGAAGYYRQALTAFPGFEDAREGLDRTQGR
jgi:TolB-like protein